MERSPRITIPTYPHHIIQRGNNRAALILAEMLEDNPNVWFECGLAHALNKSVIMLRRADKPPPFDVRHLRVIMYNSTGGDVVEKLQRHIKSVMGGHKRGG
jgi:hypothetical protein